MEHEAMQFQGKCGPVDKGSTKFPTKIAKKLKWRGDLREQAK